MELGRQTLWKMVLVQKVKSLSTVDNDILLTADWINYIINDTIGKNCFY